MTAKELRKLITDSDKEAEFTQFIESYDEGVEFDLNGLKLKVLKNHRRDEYMEVIFQVGDDLFQVNGSYDSWEGTTFYSPVSSLYKVQSKQVVRTEYVAVKEDN